MEAIMSAYVVKSWNVSEQANADGNYVEIKGRAPGLISWILALVGIEPTVSIRISDKLFIFESGSWSGRFYKSIPLAKISSVYYGYSKPWKESLAIFFVLGILLGIPTYGIMTVIGGALAFIYYYLNKTLSLGIYEIGGMASGIEIKRSVIEGKKLDETDAEKVESILKKLIDKYNKI
jgi:hypothetical protein